MHIDMYFSYRDIARLCVWICTCVSLYLSATCILWHILLLLLLSIHIFLMCLHCRFLFELVRYIAPYVRSIWLVGRELISFRFWRCCFFLSNKFVVFTREKRSVQQKKSKFVLPHYRQFFTKRRKNPFAAISVVSTPTINRLFSCELIRI